MELPIVCTLTKAERKERRRTTLDPIKNAGIESKELPDGYAYSFAASSELLTQLTRLVEMERQCCRFLTFRIVVEAGNKHMRLEVVGTGQEKSVIAELFGEATPAKPESRFDSSVVFESTITCPACGHAKSMVMPVEQCVFFYECECCHGRLRPKLGDCCVFCSYGSVACPIIQQQALSPNETHPE